MKNYRMSLTGGNYASSGRQSIFSVDSHCFFDHFVSPFAHCKIWNGVRGFGSKIPLPFGHRIKALLLWQNSDWCGNWCGRRSRKGLQQKSLFYCGRFLLRQPQQKSKVVYCFNSALLLRLFYCGRRNRRPFLLRHAFSSIAAVRLTFYIVNFCSFLLNMSQPQ